MKKINKKNWAPQDQVFWYLNRTEIEKCDQDITTEVVVIGGGMAGLSAAQAFSKRGKKVVLLEQYYCGSGASGKSSGFITPNAELSFTDFSKKYDMNSANIIWDFISSGVNDIRNNIEQYNFDCDYSKQDTLVVANSKSELKKLEIEQNNLSKFGYKASIIAPDQLKKNIGSNQYFGGFGYEDTFNINAYKYCQELKKHLISSGVRIFEETPVINIKKNSLTTPHAKITADYIIVCVDRFATDLDILKQEVYHAQTFLMASEQLTDYQIKSIFPDKNFLVWDTEFIYNYFCITKQNRLLLGGGSVLSTYSFKAKHDNMHMFNKLTNYFNKNFPGLDIKFEYMWPGLIGLSKDIAPIAGTDKNNSSVYYIAASAGLPIAAALGRYSAENLLDGKAYLDNYFSPYRKFFIDGALQSILGTKISFALSNFINRT